MPDNHATRPPRVQDRGRSAALTMIAGADGATAVLPAGYPLRQATFVCRKEHLLVRAQGHPDVFVPRFFAGGGQTTLITGDGMEMSRHMVLLMLNVSERMGRVLSELAMPGGRDF